MGIASHLEKGWEGEAMSDSHWIRPAQAFKDALKGAIIKKEDEMINWEATKEEYMLQSKIGVRAVSLAREVGIDYKLSQVVMDIEACHGNGNPLRLGDLLEADEVNFAHDVFGIMANIDRGSGKLMNWFLPRYTDYQKCGAGDDAESAVDSV